MQLSPFRILWTGKPHFLLVAGVCALFAAAPLHAQSSRDEEKKKQEILKEGRKVFSKDKEGESQEAKKEARWSVLVAIFRGEKQAEEAAKTLTEFRAGGMLPEAYIQERGEATCIVVGSFTGPEDPNAQAELKRVQEIEVNRERPYAGSYLAPPVQADLKGSIPEYNLSQARVIFGKKAVQTLQVGVYGREDIDRPTQEDLKECRKAAEDAVVKLRREGEQAYYHHGPRRSMVCVGVFDLTDFDPQVPTYKSSRLRETQRRFPYNLYNGQAIRIKRPGQAATIQPSNLVAIPEQK
jgi:hypothetical protein